MKDEDLSGLDGVSPPGATAACQSEVDSFAKGCGQVCFPEGLGHRLHEKQSFCVTSLEIFKKTFRAS